MAGMGLSIQWRKTSLECGASQFQTRRENQRLLITQGLSFGSRTAMAFGLIGFQLGFAMLLQTRIGLPHLMMVFTGTHLLQKGQ